MYHIITLSLKGNGVPLMWYHLAHPLLTHIQDFLVESVLLDDARFTLEQPIVTLRLRFRVNDALLNDGRICWALVLYGCKLSDGEYKEPSEHYIVASG